MPPSWKKSGRIARLISGLRSNRAAASSLSVETGFPTSLADLLVKNHSRLKTRKIAATAAAIQASSRPPSPPAPPNPAPAPSAQRAPSAAPSAQRAPSAAPAAQRAPAVRLGFIFLVVEMLALVLLAIGEKQLVFRITVVAFVLMVLDWLGFRVFELLTPCAEVRKGVDSESSASVSRSGSSASEVSSEGSVSGELVELREDGVVQKVSRKKSWNRLVPKRLRSKRSAAKDSVDELDSGSDGLRVSSCGSEEEEGEARDAEICVVQSVEGNACECRSVSSRRLLLFVVLLFGLAGGRVAALAVTVVWFMLTNSIDTLWRKSRVDRVC